VIDAHQHFWRPARGDYGWLDPDDAVLGRDFEPSHLAPLLEAAGIERTVLVQAAPTVAETRFLPDLARRTDFVGGVVGWVDLAAPGVHEELEALLGEGPLVGVRPMIQDIADDDWMLDPALRGGLEALTALGLRFDALVLPRHLGRLRTLLERHPDLPVVIDHGAKPPIAGGELTTWAEDMTRLARETGARCKLSGLVTEARPDWRVEDLRPWVDHLLETFGPERLLWGSDWPVVELAGGFERWREASLRLLEALDEAQRGRVLGDNAAAFYAL
jgi:L-fuconolactonase